MMGISRLKNSPGLITSSAAGDPCGGDGTASELAGCRSPFPRLSPGRAYTSLARLSPGTALVQHEATAQSAALPDSSALTTRTAPSPPTAHAASSQGRQADSLEPLLSHLNLSSFQSENVKQAPGHLSSIIRLLPLLAVLFPPRIPAPVIHTAPTWQVLSPSLALGSYILGLWRRTTGPSGLAGMPAAGGAG